MSRGSRNIPASLNSRGAGLSVGFLSIISGSLSVVSLVKHGLEMGSFFAPIQLMLDYYEATIYSLLGWWAEPILVRILSYIQRLFSWNLKLDVSWRHIFVLMMLFFGAFARQLSGPDRKAAALVWGLGFTVSI